MNNQQRIAQLQQFKQPLRTATIALLSMSAALGIILVLTGAEGTAWQIVGTTTILGLLSLLSMNNIFRLESGKPSIRVLSATALISNLFWSLPCILIIWDLLELLFCGNSHNTGSYYSSYYQSCGMTLRPIYNITITASILSMTTTAIANYLSIDAYSENIRRLRTLSVICASWIGVYFLPVIWFDEDSYLELTWRLTAVVAILLVFSNITLPMLVKSELAKVRRERSAQAQAAPTLPIDEAKLRREIEAEVRAKIATEQQQMTNRSSNDSQNSA